MYKLASEIFWIQFNQIKESIDKTLSFLREQSEMEILEELESVASDIFDCFTAEYNEIRANDSYQMVSDVAKKTTLPLMEFWQEAVEQYNLAMVA